MLLPSVVIQCSRGGTACAGAPRWREPRERAMHAMAVVVVPERLQLSRQIGRVPDEDKVQVLAPGGPYHGLRYARDCAARADCAALRIRHSQVNEQRREMAHVQQRSVGLAECNRWKSRAVRLQNSNSHPTRKTARGVPIASDSEFATDRISRAGRTVP